MSATALQVVLTGADLGQRQHLAQALQQVLHSLGLQPHLHLPPHPEDLAACPPDALHLLWTAQPRATWRAQLHQLQRDYKVVQGFGEETLKQCLFALLPPELARDWARQLPPVRWQGVCETCGDAACEQRLFSGLLQG